MSAMAGTQNAIEVTGLTKKFGAKKALDDVSFAVPKGAIFGFLGPNGAGKTTTIRCLMDYLRPTQGQLTILGKDTRTDSTELKQQIGFLSSDLQINPHWTGEEHISLAAKVKGGLGAAKDLVATLQLDTKARVKSLSTGNKQKLAVVLAFVGNPEILIMDEPTRGLDPVLQSVLNGLLRDFAKSGRTVFFSSHDLAEVQSLCDSVVFIKEGKVITSKSMFDIRGMDVHVISAVGKRAFDIPALRSQGAQIVTHNKTEVTLKIKGDFNGVIRTLAKNELTDLDMTHASLEDVFLEQYRGEQ
jgi:ABC-2 type transport system ATP-binding protein